MTRPAPMQLAGQGAAWLLFAAVVGTFAQWPAYSTITPGFGEIKLSMAHLTERLEPCERLTAEELAALPPNMRAPERCPRERAQAVVELLVNGDPLLQTTVRPVGLARGGRSYLQGRWDLPAGEHQLELRLRDTPREQGFDKVQRFSLTLAAGESVLLKLGDGDARLVPGRRGAGDPEEDMQ